MFDSISPICPRHTAREQLARSLGTLFATYLCTPYFLRLGAFALSPHPDVRGFPTLRLLCPIRLPVRPRSFVRNLFLPTLHPPSHPLQALPCSSWRTQAECGRWRVTHCPVRALRLPRGDTGEVRFTRVIGSHALQVHRRDPYCHPSIVGSGATS